MTQHDLLALLEEGVQNGRITPHLAAYITAELGSRTRDAAPDDDRDARAALTAADRRTPRSVHIN